MTPSELLKIKERADRATLGPWSYRSQPLDDWGIVRVGRFVICQARDPNVLDGVDLAAHRRAGTDPWEANAQLIAHARTDIPALLAHIAELERVIAEGKEDREEGATLIRKMSVGGWMWDQIKAAKAARRWKHLPMPQSGRPESDNDRSGK
jgi:hypothetical protein